MEPLSPWLDEVELPSPDGRWVAHFCGMEIGMGGPSLGTLVVSEVDGGRERCRLESCNASMVWSEESDVLAAPLWRRSRTQDLALVALPSGTVRVVPGPWHVLRLEAFADRVLRGVDSPKTHASAFKVALSRLEPLAFERRLPR